MSEPYVGEIRMFGGNFAPVGWNLCDGSLLSIAEYAVLFNLIGTTYGGDGVSTFAVPNLLSRVPIHTGPDGQGNTYAIGQSGGVENVTLTANQVGAHSHMVNAVNSGGSVNSPANALPGLSTPTLSGTSFQYGAKTAQQANLTSATIGNNVGGLPHDNRQPFVAVTFIISLFGVYPSQS